MGIKVSGGIVSLGCSIFFTAILLEIENCRSLTTTFVAVPWPLFKSASGSVTDTVASPVCKVLKYTVIFETAKEGGYIAYVPLLPGCITQGETYEEAKINVKDAIKMYVVCYHTTIRSIVCCV